MNNIVSEDRIFAANLLYLQMSDYAKKSEVKMPIWTFYLKIWNFLLLWEEGYPRNVCLSHDGHAFFHRL